MRQNLLSTIGLAIALSIPAWAQQPQQGTPTPGQQLIRAGKLDDALALYQADLKATPGVNAGFLVVGSLLASVSSRGSICSVRRI